MPHGSGFPATRRDARTRRPAINPRTVALSFVVGGTLTISGSLLATGILGGKDAAPDAPITASNLTGNAGSSADGRLNPPPAAPLDRTDADDSTSPSAASLLASPTPTATTAAGSSGAGNTTASTATDEPSATASTATNDPDPTATNQPANNTAAAAATNPPATATNPPATAVPSATTAPTQAPTQPPAPTATQVPPTQAPTQPPAPTATTPPPPTATATTPPPPPQSTSLHSMESAMFASHNQQRAANGVAALAIDAQLVDVARQRSQTMAQTNCFSHTACGPTAFALLGNIGYTYQIAGENIARNNYPDADTVQVAMTGFMNSTGHRNNILDSRYTKVGIGVAFGANGMKYFTVIFAGP